MNFYEKLRDYLEITQRLIQNQLRIRDQLYYLLKDSNRFDLGELEFEEMFEKFHNDMNNEELKRFRFICELTEDIAKYNSETFKLLEENKTILNDSKYLWDLYGHLQIWLAKYRCQKDNLHPSMVYTGVEDIQGFPQGIEKFVSDRIDGLKNRKSQDRAAIVRVAAVEKAPPRLVYTVPSDGDVNVPITSHVSATFSDPMSSLTIKRIHSL